MSESKYCRICLDSGVRMLPISGSKVQDVYEKLTNKKVQEDGTLYYACFICHRHLQICYQLIVKLERSDELLKQMLCTELGQKSVSNADRRTHGLVYSLTCSDVETFNTSEFIKNIKTENESGGEDDEAMVSCDVAAVPCDVLAVSCDETVVKVEPDDVNICTRIICVQGVLNMNKQSAFINEESHGKIVKENEQEKHKELKRKRNCERQRAFYQRQKDLKKNEEKKIKKKVPKTNAERQREFRQRKAEKSYGDMKRRKLCCNVENVVQGRAVEKIENVTLQENQFHSQQLHIYEQRNECITPEVILHRNTGIPDDGTSTNKKLDEKHILKEDKDQSVESGRKKNISETQTSIVAQENNLIPIEFDAKSNQVSDVSRRDTKALLFKHLRTHKPMATTTRTFENPTSCVNKFMDNDNLTQNIIQPLEMTYKCQCCDFTSTDYWALKIHYSTHTREKLIQCQYCDYRSAYKSNLKVHHIRYHIGEKPFKCQYCDFTSADNWGLKVHNKTHSEEKPFQCQYCDFKSAYKPNLKKHHNRTHTGEKPFKCQYCDFTCADSTSLKIHNRTHTGEKPFQCQYCDYRCAYKGSLQKHHIKYHTGEKPFTASQDSFGLCHGGDKSF